MWSKEADVVVVGYGGAGAATAITAHDAGAKVIILEKMPKGGGNTCYSNGTIREYKDVEQAIKYIEGFSFGVAGRDMIKTLIEECQRTPAWLKTLGGELGPHMGSRFPPAPALVFPHLPGAEGIGAKWEIRGSTGTEAGGVNLWGLLSRNVEEVRKIELLLNTAASHLIQNEKGEVIGVAATTPNGEIRIKAKRAVVLTCGGFEFNAEMQRQFYGVTYAGLGNPGNTGDGIRMAQELGADLWHMNAIACTAAYRVPDHAPMISSMRTAGFIWVDQEAKRYLDEPGFDLHHVGLVMPNIDLHTLRRPKMPSYVIFDEETRRAGPVTMSAGKYTDDYQWSEDNLAEIDKGWISKGDTVAELAKKLGLDARALQKTVADYNLGCVAGYDADFNRTPDTLIPLVSAPFYGIALWPCLLNTQGGPRRNTQAQILNVNGQPIKRLYSAGELGSIWGAIYPGAGNVSESMAFGRIAGKNAVAQKPWE